MLGRIQLGPLDIGLQDGVVPRTIWFNGAAVGLLYGLLGMGLILVYRANRIINFAQAALGTVPAVLCLQLINARGVNYWLTLPILLVTAVALGAFVDVAIMRRFRDAPRLIATVATIGISLLLTAGEVVVPEGRGRRAHHQRSVLHPVQPVLDDDRRRSSTTATSSWPSSPP